MRVSTFLVAAAVLAASVAACREPPGPGEVLVVKIASGDGQTATVGQQLPTPLAVRVDDVEGRLVYGLTVVFRVTAGGGAVAPETSTTTGSGLAQARWTLGTSTADSQRVEATVVDPRSSGTVAVARFRATARADRPVGITKLGGDAQTGNVGVALPQPLRVQVLDRYGNGVPGVLVNWSLDTTFGGTLSFPETPTDEAGETSNTWTLGFSLDNTQRVTAAVSSLPSVTFSVVPQLPTTAVLEALGDSQGGLVGTALADSVALRIQVPSPNGPVYVRGARVTFAVTSGGGSITPSQVLTDGFGAAWASWVLGGAPGENKATASFGGRSASFTAMGFQPVGAAAIAAGAAHSCAITASGAAYCWGANGNGQLGDGTATARGIPVAVLGGPTFTTLAGGAAHTCGLDAAGVAWCWGDNTAGQLGDGTRTSRPNPAAVAGGPAFASLVLGRLHTCGLTSSGAAYCWGDNTFAQLGDSTTSTRASPAAVAGGLVFTRLAAGDDHTCGVTAGGTTYCWGSDSDGQLGAATGETCTVASVPCRRTPIQVATTLGFTDLVARYQHTCALTSSGAAYCWGAGSESLEPVPNAPAFSRLSAGASTCALTASGQAYCWDVYLDYDYGGRVVEPANPVPGGLGFAALTGGVGHSCAIRGGGQPYVYCWGANDNGQLGDGTTRSRGTPAPVVLVGP